MPSFRKGKKKDEAHGEDAVKHDEENVAKTEGETKVETEEKENEPVVGVAASKPKKKKFSFIRKKKPTKSYSKDDINKDSTLVEVEPGKMAVVQKEDKSGAPVRRAQSLVLEEPEKRRKFWKINRSKSSKKAGKGANNTTASEHDTSSVVTNPDMDEWRMSGLLNTVEKSNTAFSNSKTNVSEGLDDSKTNDSVKAVATSTPTKSSSQDKDSTDNAEQTKNNTMSQPKGESAKEKVPENDKFVETPGLDYEYASEIHSSKTNGMEPVEEEAVDETRVDDVECSPNFDGGIFGASVYPLDKKRKIVARDLCDVIRDGQIEMDKAVDVSDWLVLNLSKEDWVIVDCKKEDDEVVELRDTSVEAV